MSKQFYIYLFLIVLGVGLLISQIVTMRFGIYRDYMIPEAFISLAFLLIGSFGIIIDKTLSEFKKYLEEKVESCKKDK